MENDSVNSGSSVGLITKAEKRSKSFQSYQRIEQY